MAGNDRTDNPKPEPDPDAIQRVDPDVTKAVDEWFSGKPRWPAVDRDRHGGGR